MRIRKPEGWERYGLKSWIEAAKQRLHRNVLAIALANKNSLASPGQFFTRGACRSTVPSVFTKLQVYFSKLQ
jgi:hypothetical protein